jgi:polysaccharide export outer membrane protein
MHRIFIPLLASLLAGCASTPSVLKSATIPVVQNSELPTPEVADLTSPTRPYTIGPFDKLSIQVFGAEDLSAEEIQADANGNIQVPLMGQLNAGGKTPGQLARMIEQGLRAYIKNPSVAVNLVDTVSQVYTVEGQDGKPGL